MMIEIYDLDNFTVTIGGVELPLGDMIVLEPCPPWARWERFRERRASFRRARRSFAHRMRQRRSWGLRT